MRTCIILSILCFILAGTGYILFSGWIRALSLVPHLAVVYLPVAFACTWGLLALRFHTKAGELSGDREPFFFWKNAAKREVYGTKHPASALQHVPDEHLPKGKVLRLAGGTKYRDLVLDEQGHECTGWIIRFSDRPIPAVTYSKSEGTEFSAPLHYALALDVINLDMDVLHGLRENGAAEAMLTGKLNRVTTLQSHEGQNEQLSMLEFISRHGKTLIEALDEIFRRLNSFRVGQALLHGRIERTNRAMARLRAGMAQARDAKQRTYGTKTTINLFDKAHIDLALAFIELVDLQGSTDLTPSVLMTAGISPEQAAILRRLLYEEEVQQLAETA